MAAHEIPNAEMIAAWDGPEGQSWAANADRYERASREHRAVLLDALHVEPDASVIDVGCGAGALTIELGRRAPRGRALGVDLSSQMLAVARSRAAQAGFDQVAFEQGDAQVQPLWIGALRSALAMGRDLPEPPAGAPGPFSLADPSVARGRLEAAGFTQVRTTPVDQSVCYGSDPADAFEFVSTLGAVQGLMADLDDDTRAQALVNLRNSLADHATPDGVLYGSAAWLVQASTTT